MSLKNIDTCIECKKLIKTCHKNICCKTCNGFIHKKCTKLKQKQLKCLVVKDWVCNECNSKRTKCDSNSDLETEINELNNSSLFKLDEIDFKKYDDMIFNPLLTITLLIRDTMI